MSAVPWTCEACICSALHRFLDSLISEVMSAQATSALLNGTPQGSGGQSAGYGSADADLVERPVLSRIETLEGVEQSERAAAPPATADVNGPEAPSSSNHLEGAGSATTGIPPASRGRPVTEDGFPELQSGMQSSAQRAEIATGLVDAVTSAGLPDVGVDPGDLGGNRGYFTPRSRTSQFGGPATSGPGYWPGWMSRIGELFTHPTAPAWMPSPIPSPPRPPSQLARRSLDLRAAEDDGSLGFRPASRNFATPPSSSIPAEAIQAEVQRQLGSLLDRLSVAEAENAKLQDALLRERSLTQGRVPSTQQPQTVTGSGCPAVDVHSAVPGLSGVPPSSHDSVPPVSERPARDPLGRAPGQSGLGDPWTAIWEGISGKFGSRARTGASGGTTSLAPIAPKTTAPATDVSATPVQQPPTGSSNEILEALTQGMQQRQDLQMKAMKKDTDNSDFPEVVKTATVNLPELRPPLGETCGLVLQDWLVQVTTAMQDLSATSGDWWEQVREKVAETYSLWLEATPLERLQVMPADHQKLSSGRWMRVNARACALMMQSFAEVVKADLIARRSTQSAVMVLFRLYTTYQPGGAAERAVVLRHLQGSDPPTDVAACLDALRSWPRWLQRCKDMNMTVPDGSILARSLTNTASKFLGESQDAVFRTQLVRSTYRIAQPKIEDVVRYQQHLQAEIENIAISKATSGGPVAAMKAITPATSGSPSSSSAARPCKYFLKASGYRRGGKCPFQHSLEGLSKLERSRKCLSCGSEEHRAKECPTKIAKPPSTTRTAADRQQPSTPTSSTTPAVAKATVEPEGESSPQKEGSETVLQGQPVLTWEALLHAAAKVAGTPPTEPKAPSLRVVAVRGCADGSEDPGGAYALVDSGATHPLRKAVSEEEWQQAKPVVVHLAGGEVVELKMNAAGTLLIPTTGNTRSTSTCPIVPLGSLVGVLGYRMEWRGNRCRLISREGQAINLRVRDGCPEVTEVQALELIARIEEEKLTNLVDATSVTKGRIRESVISMNKTWFDHLISYCRSGVGSEALKAIHKAPFLQELPPENYAGLSEAAPISNGWDALKGLRHLNRRTRKKLWSSHQWVVHLYSGKAPNEEVMFLERQGFVVLELDLERGKSHDVCDPLVWRALEWAARPGRIVSSNWRPTSGHLHATAPYVSRSRTTSK